MIPLRKLLAVDGDPLGIHSLEKFAVANQGTGTVEIQVSFDDGASAWIVLDTIGPGEICTNPATLPADTLNSFRPLWIRAVETVAGDHEVYIVGSQ